MWRKAARLRCERVGAEPESVALITSRPLAALSHAASLEASILHWGIETGLHARLDASRHDDRCRLHGAFTRWANSLFIHWRRQQPNGHHLTTTDHQSHFGEDHARRAIRAVTAITAVRFPSCIGGKIHHGNGTCR